MTPNDLASNNAELLETLRAAAAGIAHDLNNQLTLIVNHLSVRNIPAALSAMSRCSDLTSCLLQAGRGEPLPLEPASAAELLREFTAHTQLPEGVRLFVNVPPNLPAILANPVAVSRALVNLVDNACAAMEKSGTLRITASGQSIEVSDSGPGIPPERILDAFVPFYSTKSGPGLGLPIVREIMRQHGGSVTLHTDQGRGARFTLRFRPAVTPARQGKILKGSPRKIAPAA